MPTASAIKHKMAVGNSQLGLRTMSSNVALGENSTPTIRPIGEIEAFTSGAGTGTGLVAIEDPFAIANHPVLSSIHAYRRKNITPLRLLVFSVIVSSNSFLRPGAILVSMLGIFQEPLPPGTRDPQEDKLDPKLLLLTPRPRVVKMGWPIIAEIIVCILLFAMFAFVFRDAVKGIRKANFADLPF